MDYPMPSCRAPDDNDNHSQVAGVEAFLGARTGKILRLPPKIYYKKSPITIHVNNKLSNKPWGNYPTGRCGQRKRLPVEYGNVKIQTHWGSFQWPVSGNGLLWLYICASTIGRHSGC